MHNLNLINTLIGGLTAAFVFGFIAQKLRLSPIVGYLLAGILISPYTPGFVADGDVANQFAEVGVILLMFGVGLHFHLKDLLAVQKVALPGAAAQITAATVLGMLVSHAFGWSWAAGAVYGMAISVASTVVLTRVLSDNRALHTPSGHVALGWLVVEDLFTILALVLLPVIFGGTGGGNVWGALGWTIIKLVGLVLFTLIVGQKLVPLLLTYVARTGTRDLFTLAVLAVALGIALGSAYVFGASMALGAFLAGMVVGQSDFSARAAAEALPMRDAFAVLFFVSVGMLFDPMTVVTNWQLSLATLGIVMIGKPLAAVLVVLLLRKPARMAVVVGAALAQIGEFSFILASLAATELKIMPVEASSAIVLAAIISITLNPFVYKHQDFWVRLLLERAGLGRMPLGGDDCGASPQSDRERMIIVGYGPLGRTLGRILLSNDIEVVVVEMNIDTVKDLKMREELAVFGDATQMEVLKHAGIEHASSLIISSSGVPARDVVKAARELNPGIRIVMYVTYMREAEALRDAGATIVFSGEREVAISMAEWLMDDLNATDEQIERERRRIRSELL